MYEDLKGGRWAKKKLGTTGLENPNILIIRSANREYICILYVVHNIKTCEIENRNALPILKIVLVISNKCSSLF